MSIITQKRYLLKKKKKVAPPILPPYFLHSTEIICNFLVYLSVYLFVVCLKTVNSLRQELGLIYRWGGFPQGHPEAIARCLSTTLALNSQILLLTDQRSIR